MIEIWKMSSIAKGYEVSNTGSVRNSRTKKVLKPVMRNNYPSIVIKPASKSRKSVSYTIHKLVATEFISNPNNYPQINHINGKKSDNRIENLEWVTAKGNTEHAIRAGLRDNIANAHKKAIVQLTLDEIFVARYSSTVEAAKINGFSRTALSECVRGKNRTSYGYIWRKEGEVTEFNGGNC